MTAEFFADSNLIVYAGSKDPADAKKKKIARELIESQDIGISVQVLQEFIAAASTKKRLGIDDAETRRTVVALLAFPLVSITPDLVVAALGIKARFQLSYWDAAIIAAAKELECTAIYSEDLNDGQDYGGVRIINPFKE